MSKKTRNLLIALAVVLCAALVILFTVNGSKQATPAATEAPAAETAVEEAVEETKEAAEGAAETVTEAVEGAAETATEAAEGAAETATEAVEGTAETVTEAVEGAAEGAKEVVTEAEETAAEAVNTAAEGAAEAVEEVGETVAEAAQDVAEGAEEAVVTAAEEVVEAAEGTVAETPEVFVTVNGKVITKDEYNSVFETLQSYYANAGYTFSTEEDLNLLKGISIEQAVMLELIDQKAVELGLDTFTEEEEAAMQQEASEQMASTLESYMTYYGLTPAEDASEEEKTAARTNALAALEAMGYTEASFLENIRSNELYNRVRAEVVKDIQASDEDVQNAFDAKVASDEQMYAGNVAMYEFYTNYYGQKSYYVPEGYRGVIHILLNVDEALLNTYQDLQARLEEQQEATATDLATPTDAEATATDTEATATDAEASPTDLVTQEDVDAAYAAVIASVQPTIDEIKQKLADGVSFEDLIAEYGQDPGMKDEATLRDGYSVHRDSIAFDPAFVEAAFSVEHVGDVAEPVVGSYGVHIVKYHRDVPAGAVELTDDIKAELADSLVGDQQVAAFNAAMTEWMDAAEIVYSAEAQAIMDAMYPAEEATPTDAEATATDAE